MSILSALTPNSAVRTRVMSGAALRAVCEKLSRAEFLAAYDHAWLVTGLPGQEEEPSFRTALAEPGGPGASGLMSALAMNADKVELHPLRALSVGETRLVLGRASSCDVVLRHASVSKQHAVLVHRAGAWSVADTGSTNGTFANFRPVPAKGAAMPLLDKALLRFGSVGCALMLSTGDVYDALNGHGGR